jgi:hypothetical protein
MGGGVLLYQRKASDFLINILKRIDGKLPADLRKFAERKIGAKGVAAIERDLAETTPLALMAPTFSGIWLADTLERTIHPQVPTLVNADGHPIVMCTTTFLLLPTTNAAACRKALGRMPDLSASDAEVFNWVRMKGVDPASISSPRENAIILMTTSARSRELVESTTLPRLISTLPSRALPNPLVAARRCS